LRQTTNEKNRFDEDMPGRTAAGPVRKKLLMAAFTFVILSVCVFPAMGYYYLTYRNKLMENAIMKSSQMSMSMLVQDLELDIISLENKMILDLALQGAHGVDDEQRLAAVRSRNPIVGQLFFYPSRTDTAASDNLDPDVQAWLVGRMEAEMKKATPPHLALNHFSGHFHGLPVQAGFIRFSPAPGEDTNYLIFTLDLSYIRRSLLPARTGKADGALTAITIQPSNAPTPYATPGDCKTVSVETPFAQILPFWLVSADIDTSGMEQRARMELIAYTGIIALVLLLIIVSIYFIWIQMQQERRLSQVKSQMISHVSHELKTPLALIRMYAETLMLGRIAEQSKTRQYYRIILSECDRLHLLINNTLDFSSIEKGMKKYNLSTGDITQVVRDIVTSYNYFLEEHGFSLQTDLAPGISPFAFDRMAMRQIVGNLLDNAMKFSPDTKDIRLKLMQKENSVVLEVADHGVGIRAEALAAIFKPYHRLSNRFRGSGLGLSLVKHAVEAHHGSIEVHSIEGRGSTFVVTLPLRGMASPTQEKSGPESGLK
jgi:signal transduction histidine kinase